MGKASRFWNRLTLLAVACAVVASTAISKADSKELYKKLADEVGPALVTVKCVLKMQGPGGAQEKEQEFTAVMIESDGLVLCSGIQLGTSRLYRQMGGTITPTDIKVMIGEDTEGVAARLITSDPELDLSWIRIKEPDAKGYKSLDLARIKKAELGDRLLSAHRMDKFFDRALVVNEGYLGAITRKPRELLVPTKSLEFGQSNIGMPVFADDGSLVGVAVLQSPDPEDMDARSRTSAEVLVLPASEVAKATAKAKTVTPPPEEEEEGATTKPADKEAPKPVEKAPAKPGAADEEEDEE